MLVALKDQWHGTLIMIVKPAGRRLSTGARAMLADGLNARFPQAGLCLSLHDSADVEAGKNHLLSAMPMASGDLRGSGDRVWVANGARPEATKIP